MKQPLFLIFALVLSIAVTSCDTPNDLNNNVGMIMEFEFEGNQYRFDSSIPKSRLRFGANENCESVFVTSTYYEKKRDEYVSLNFQLSKSGTLNSVQLVKQANSPVVLNQSFQSTLFDPAIHFQIKNFVYEPDKQNLSFEFEGELFDFKGLPVEINGFFNGKSLVNTNCTAVASELTNTGDFEFLTSRAGSSITSSVNKSDEYEYSFYSQNGYAVIFKFNSSLKSLSKGVYALSSDANEMGSITVMQYKGGPATQAGSPNIDWKTFTADGSLEVIEQISLHGFPVTDGKLALKIYDQGNQVAQFTDGSIRLLNVN